jgi:hypothetical protein
MWMALWVHLEGEESGPKWFRARHAQGRGIWSHGETNWRRDSAKPTPREVNP